MHGGIEEASERKPSLPDATGAFLPTDIEGSARVWASARVKTAADPDARFRAHRSIRPAR